MNFKFNLGQAVVIDCSGETGQVVGRAQYLSGEQSYQVRYKAADGRAVEAWWAENALTSRDQCERQERAEPEANNVSASLCLKKIAMTKTFVSFLRAVETGSVTNPPRLFVEMTQITDQYLSKMQEESLDK